MTIEQALMNRLRADQAVISLVGEGVLARIYPNQLPANPVFPCVAYYRISSERPLRMGGHTGNTWARYQFSCFAKTYIEARALSEAIRKSLEFYSTQTPVVIDLIQFESDYDTFLDESNNDLNIYNCAADYFVKYQS